MNVLNSVMEQFSFLPLFGCDWGMRLRGTIIEAMWDVGCAVLYTVIDFQLRDHIKIHTHVLYTELVQ